MMSRSAGPIADWTAETFNISVVKYIGQQPLLSASSAFA
jgi:hypothetical protein